MSKEDIIQPPDAIISFILSRWVVNPDLQTEMYGLAIGIAIAIVLQFRYLPFKDQEVRLALC